MYYTYSYLRDGVPYYVGKGCGFRAYNKQNHYCPLPEDRENIHIIAHYEEDFKAQMREWELITFLGLKSEGGMLDNKVKGAHPPNNKGKHWKLSEKTKNRQSGAKSPEHLAKLKARPRDKNGRYIKG